MKSTASTWPTELALPKTRRRPQWRPKASLSRLASRCEHWQLMENTMNTTLDQTGTMKAVRIHSFGGPESLLLEDVPAPTPGPGEVQVRVHAAGVNPLDWKTLEGLCGPLTMPRTLGCDFSGAVEALGPGVTD